MYSRTALLLDEFTTAFTDADEVVIVDIFASRDTPEAMAATTAEDLADAIERASGIPTIATGRRRTPRPPTSPTTWRPATRCWSWAPGSRIASPAASPSGWLVIGARAALLGLLLALAVAIAYQGIVALVEASGARDQPAIILILLLSAFLGVLTAVATRMLRLPGATAPTVLVLGWTLIPVILAAIPSDATQLFGADGSLTSGQATRPRHRDRRGGGDAWRASRAPDDRSRAARRADRLLPRPGGRVRRDLDAGGRPVRRACGGRP